jgi:cation diffusion facilitator CzcD-associated flavoprotein CzcO
MMDKPNVHIVEVKKTPISEFAADGIITSDGKLRKFDAIALATGYDAVDGGLREMGIKDRHGRTLSQKWAEGIRTSLGMMMTDMPNLFVTYGPHSPSSFTNGPVFIQIQVDW